MRIFFTSDLHFGHENVLKFDDRPFETVEEMDEELIRRWNNKVDKGDLVYVLGDLIWKSAKNEALSIINKSVDVSQRKSPKSKVKKFFNQ